MKQQLSHDYWQCLSIGASLWNLNVSSHLNFLWELERVWMYLYPMYRHGFGIYSIEIRFTCDKTYFNSIKIKIKPTLWSYRLTLELEFRFIFILISAINFKSFQRSMTTCAYNACSIAINFMLFLNSSGTHWSSFALSLHFFIKLSGKTRSFEISFFYNFVDCPPWSCIYFVSFSNVLIFSI